MKDKTAMQELKEKLLTTTFLSGQQMVGIQPILDKLLEKEKQQIIDAHIDGQCVIVDTVLKELKFDFKATVLEISKAKNDSNDIEAINYFNQTYNQ